MTQPRQRNLVERLTVLSPGTEITPADVALHVGTAVPDGETGLASLGELERRHIVKVLQHTAGNRARAAKILDAVASCRKQHPGSAPLRALRR